MKRIVKGAGGGEGVGVPLLGLSDNFIASCLSRTHTKVNTRGSLSCVNGDNIFVRLNYITNTSGSPQVFLLSRRTARKGRLSNALSSRGIRPVAGTLHNPSARTHVTRLSMGGGGLRRIIHYCLHLFEYIDNIRVDAHVHIYKRARARAHTR